MDADLLILPEIHCSDDQKIDMQNYYFFQKNRSKVGNLGRGSGGIAIGIKKYLLNFHDIIAVYDDSCDGLIGLKVKNKLTDMFVGVVAMYLSPDNYRYGQDAEGFFNNAAVMWQDLLDCDLLIGGGDLNSRTQELLDFIPDIDGGLISKRFNPDKIKNAHGDSFLTFLKENRSLILNGRITPELNNFTFVSPQRGSSVPDYIFCPTEHLDYCTEARVLLISDIVNESGIRPPLNLPDHSIIKCTFETSFFTKNKQIIFPQPSPHLKSQRRVKKDLKKIDDKFFMSDETKCKVDVTIKKLEAKINNQNELDTLWNEVQNLILNELETLPDIPKSCYREKNKQFKKSQKFWNENLETAWRAACKAEKDYLNYKANLNSQLQQKQYLHNVFKEKQKIFDCKFRFFKRKAKKQQYNELESLAKNDPREMWAYLKRLGNPPTSRAALQIVRDDGSISADIKEVLERWHKDISNLFSGLRQNPTFAFDDSFYEEVVKKKSEFENIANEANANADQEQEYSSSKLNETISFAEVAASIDRVKLRKSYLQIPNEALKNKNAKLLFHKFFNLCFSSGLSPSAWDQSDIKPIPKKDKDDRDPLQNRCITIMCCVAKIYSGILNRRLQTYLEKNKILIEEQNGFRASRSCIDHVLVLCTILRNRKSMNLSTFLAFIDFQKAFDSVDRHLLLFKLSKIGISGNFYGAISAMYANPRARIILNEHETNYFDCPIGVKQGDCISATLFAIFINDLGEEIKNSGVGLKLNMNAENLDQNILVNILMYADDLILLSENEADMQFLLHLVEIWCKKWRLEVNLSKTNIMHVRNPRRCRSIFMFIFNNRRVDYCSTYKYLGVTLNEFLNFNFTANSQSESAGRALGAIITKTIKNGGLPYQIYTTLFDSCCTSITDYGAEIWGFERREGTMKIHLRAARSFLGLPKNATSVGILAEINWLEPVYRTQLRMVRQFFRVQKLSEEKLPKLIMLWDKNVSDQFGFQTWYNEVKTIFDSNNLSEFFGQGSCIESTIQKLKESMWVKQNVDSRINCLEKPKLRTFVTFKDFGSTPPYILKPLSFVQRKFIAKIRLSALPIRIETGRYERPKLEIHERLCPSCNDGHSIENEDHFIFQCTKYSEIRQIWMDKLKKMKIFLTLIPPRNLKLFFINQKILK